MSQSPVKTKEILIITTVAAVIGVLFTVMDWLYMPLSAVLGSVFMELTFGLYMLSAALPMYLVRKPGYAIYGALVAAGVNLLLGSPYGIQLVLAGLLEGIGVELGYLCFGRHRGNWANLVIGQVLGATLVLCRDAYFFGTPFSLGSVLATAQISVRVLSSVVIGILLIKGISFALHKAGILKDTATCTQ